MRTPDPVKEKKRRRKALFAMLFTHAGIVALLLLVSWTEPDPLPEPEEIVLEFVGGSSSSNGGASSSADTPQPAVTESAEKVITDKTNTENKVVTGNSNKPNNTTTQTNTQTVNPNALFNSTGNTGQDTGPDLSNGPDGPGGNGPGGTGTSPYKPGLGMSLNGREQLYFPKPANPDYERGKIVMIIWVNQQGVVTRASVDAAHSTTNDATLIAECKKSLIGKQLVNANLSAPAEQKGYYEFEFRVD